jgi:O-antigen ligase
MSKQLKTILITIVIVLTSSVIISLNGLIYLALFMFGILIFFIAWRYPVINLLVILATVIWISPQFGTENQTAYLADLLYNNIYSFVKISPIELWIFLSLVLVFPRQNRNTVSDFLKNPIFLSTIIFIAICLYGLVLGTLSGNTNDAFREIRPILVFFSVLVLGGFILNRLDDFQILKFINILFFFTLLKAIQGLIIFFTIKNGYTYEGVLRVFGGVEILSCIWFMVFGLFSIIIMKTKKTSSIVMTLPIIAMWFLSFSRSIWLGGIVALSVAFIHISINGKRFFRSLAIFILLVISLYLVLFSSGQIGDKIQSYFSTIDPSSNEVTNTFRILEAKNALENIKNQPILGYGLGYQVDLFTEFQESGVPTQSNLTLIHNSFLWLWLKMGILGPLSFIMIFVITISTTFKNISKLYENKNKIGFIATGSIISCLSGLMVVLNTGNWLLNSRVMIFLGLLLSLQIIFMVRTKNAGKSVEV